VVYLTDQAIGNACHERWGDAVANCLPEPKVAWVLPPGEHPKETPDIPITLARGATLPDHEKVARMLDALDERLADLLSQPMSKGANHTYSPTLRDLSELSGYLPGGQLSWSIPGLPRHLQGMRGGGLLGAGLGYGTGWLASRLMPETWDRDRLPRTMAILGAGAGVAPGLRLCSPIWQKGQIPRETRISCRTTASSRHPPSRTRSSSRCHRIPRLAQIQFPIMPMPRLPWRTIGTLPSSSP
jgi:hypothetical protein